MSLEYSDAFAPPGEYGSPVPLQHRYDNFIGGEWTAPTTGEYRENLTPSTGEPFCELAHSSAQDIELALDAAHAAKDDWGRRSPTERAAVLNAMADRIDENLELLAVAESYENGKPVRETLAADIPLSADHLRSFAGAIRAQEGRISEIDDQTYAYHFHEPLGVVGQIIPFNFPLLIAVSKMAPALAAGNCTVIKPASPTPWSILKLMEVLGDLVPPGVINVVNGPGAEIGKALAANKRIALIDFAGETVTGRLIASYAAQNLIPSMTALGGKSPNIFFEDIMAADDDFLDKAVEGVLLFAFNKGEACACPSRALIQESIYEVFIERVLARVAVIKQGDPLDRSTMIGAQVSTSQLQKIEGYVQIGRDEGAELLIGGRRPEINGRLSGGYYYEPTVLKGHNKMRVFQEEILGPVLAVTTFKDERRHSRSPTTRRTAWRRECGPAMGAVRSGWAAGSRPAACGSTLTTCTPRLRHSVGTRAPASVARTPGWCSSNTRRRSVCLSATTRIRSASSRTGYAIRVKVAAPKVGRLRTTLHLFRS